MKLWTDKVSECIAAFPQKTEKGQDSDPVTIKGGSENGMFCVIADVKPGKVTYHTGSRLQVDAVILEVQGQKVAGYTQRDLSAWIHKVGHNGAPIMFKTVQPIGSLVVDLRAYLSARFQKGSPDHDLQITIRDNLYQRTVPCTTRGPRPGEVDGVDYTFLSSEVFFDLERTGNLLESGLYDGNYYGTPKPSRDGPSAPKRPSGAMATTSSVLPGARPSSEGKRKRNRSSIEATSGTDGEGAAVPLSPPNSVLPNGRRESLRRAHSDASNAGAGGGQQEEDNGASVHEARPSAHEARPLPRVPVANGRGGAPAVNNISDNLSNWLNEQSEGRGTNVNDDLELPVGWEKVKDPKYGTYYIDHVNRTTQYDHPLSNAAAAAHRRSPALSQRSIASKGGASTSRSAVASPAPSVAGSHRLHRVAKPSPFFTKNPADLCGERLQTSLVKSPRGFGFTIVGSDEPDTEFLQIKHVLSNGPAHQDHVLRTGDVLVSLNGRPVLGCTHADVVSLFQSIRPGEKLLLDVCRGYPLSFDPTDPNTEIVTTVAVTKPEPAPPPSNSEQASPAMSGRVAASGRPQVPAAAASPASRSQLAVDDSNDNDSLNEFADSLVHDLSQKNRDENSRQPSMSPAGFKDDAAGEASDAGGSQGSPEVLAMQIVRGPEGFGFTIADSVHGQKVKSVLDRGRCRHLLEGDILVEINDIDVKHFNHTEVVRVLKSCPLGRETRIVVERGGIGAVKAVRSNSKKSLPVQNTQAEGSIPGGFGRSSNNTTNGNHRKAEEGVLTPRAAAGSQGHGQQAAEDTDSEASVTPPPVPVKVNTDTIPNVSPAATATAAAEPAMLNVGRHEHFEAPHAAVSPASLAATERLLAAPAAVTTVTRAPASPPAARRLSQQDVARQLQQQLLPSQSLNGKVGLLSRPPEENGVNRTHLKPAVSVTSQDSQGAKPESQYSSPTRHQPWVREGEPLPLPQQLSAPESQQLPGWDQDRFGLQYRPIEQAWSTTATVAELPNGGRPEVPAQRRARTPGPEATPTVPLDSTPPAHNSRFRSKTPNPVEDRRGRPLAPLSQPFRVDSGWQLPGAAVGGGSGIGNQPSGSAPPIYQQMPAQYAAQQADVVAAVPVYREQVVELEVTLYRHESGFGFRIVGGPEEGTQVAIGYVVPRGAADLDGRLQTGDEIIAVDGVSTLGESHHRVVQLMGGSASRGRVDMRVRRRMLVQASPPIRSTPMPPPPRAVEVLKPCDVTVTRREKEGFGFIIVSSVTKPDAKEGEFKIGRIIEDSPAMRSGRLHVGDRILAVNGHSISGLQHEDIVNIIKDSGYEVTLTLISSAGSTGDHKADGSPYATMLRTTAMPAMSESDTMMRGASTNGDGRRQSLMQAAGTWQDKQDALSAQQRFASATEYPGSSSGGDFAAAARNGPLLSSQALLQPLPGQYDADSFSGNARPPQTQRSRENSVTPAGSSSGVQFVPGNSRDGDDGAVLVIELARGSRGFGFSIRGGQEFNNMPLYVLRIAEDGAADTDRRLKVGDELLEINNYKTTGMTHTDAINLIQSGGSKVRLVVRRVASNIDSPPQPSPAALSLNSASAPSSSRLPNGPAMAMAPPAGQSRVQAGLPYNGQGGGNGFSPPSGPGSYRNAYEAGGSGRAGVLRDDRVGSAGLHDASRVGPAGFLPTALGGPEPQRAADDSSRPAGGMTNSGWPASSQPQQYSKGLYEQYPTVALPGQGSHQQPRPAGVHGASSAYSSRGNLHPQASQQQQQHPVSGTGYPLDRLQVPQMSFASHQQALADMRGAQPSRLQSLSALTYDPRLPPDVGRQATYGSSAQLQQPPSSAFRADVAADRRQQNNYGYQPNAPFAPEQHGGVSAGQALGVRSAGQQPGSYGPVNPGHIQQATSYGPGLPFDSYGSGHPQVSYNPGQPSTGHVGGNAAVQQLQYGGAPDAGHARPPPHRYAPPSTGGFYGVYNARQAAYR